MKNGLILMGLVVGLASCGGESASNSIANSEGGTKIAYYVKDSLALNLEIFKDGQEALEVMNESYVSKAAAMQKEYQRVGQLYESRRSQGLLSPDDEAYYGRKLGKLQEQMAGLEQTEGADLQSKVNEFQLELLDKLTEHAKDYATSNGIHLFLTKDELGTILYADSTMDVTMDFIKFMNDAEKSK